MKVRILAVILCFAGTFAASSQTKVGTIDSELIVGLMPETKTVIKLLGDYTKRLDSSYQIKVTEYQKKVEAYQKLTNVSDAFKKVKVDEINQLNAELQKNQQNGNQLIQLKRDELMRPLYKKLGDVINEFSKANGYTQILITSNNQFAYIDEKYDITKNIMSKLGIEIPKPKQQK